MHRPIRHRGPDDERFLIIDSEWQPRVVRAAEMLPSAPMVAGVAFRRLRVVDLSDAAAQPMASSDQRTWICFNGEIYNFRSLRDRLSGLGLEFRSHSDTEVALAAYRTWGTRCFEELDGMWAMVIVDLDRRTLVVSRDRFGIKPLQWATIDGRVLFASEIKQIVDLPGWHSRAHGPLVTTFLTGNRIPALDETFFQGVRPFPQASFAEIPLEAGELRWEPKAFWDLASIERRRLRERDYPATVDAFEDVLQRALETHSVADVNVGYLLSGGLDSSALVALMAATARKDRAAAAPVFSFGFRERAPEFCELRYADAVAKKADLALRETTLDGPWIAANAGRVMRAVEEPVLGTPALAQYRIFEFCRQQGMTVIIDGEGSDEVLGGYPGYQFNLLRDYLEHGRVVKFGRELRAMARREGRSPIALMNDIRVRRRTRAPTNYDWIDAEYGRRSQEGSRELLAAVADCSTARSRVSRMLFRDVKWGNVKIVLGYTDRVSMAHSIEARVPYLDLSLVTMAFSLPDEFKVGNGDRKRILRDVGRRYLPSEVTERKDRMGFGMPDALLLGEIWTDVEARVDSVTSSGAFRREALQRFVSDFRAGRHNDLRAIWRIYALARWVEEFEVAL